MDKNYTNAYVINNAKAGSDAINNSLSKVLFDGKLVELTAREFDVLKLLSLNPETVFTRERLLEMVWGYDYYGDSRAVDIQIRRLRKKIERDPSNPKFILTKWGEGYFYKNVY